MGAERMELQWNESSHKPGPLCPSSGSREISASIRQQEWLVCGSAQRPPWFAKCLVSGPEFVLWGLGNLQGQCAVPIPVCCLFQVDSLVFPRAPHTDVLPTGSGTSPLCWLKARQARP